MFVRIKSNFASFKFVRNAPSSQNGHEFYLGRDGNVIAQYRFSTFKAISEYSI